MMNPGNPKNRHPLRRGCESGGVGGTTWQCHRTGEKKHHGIGFKNDSGGYEIRTPYAKPGRLPKDITAI